MVGNTAAQPFNLYRFASGQLTYEFFYSALFVPRSVPRAAILAALIVLIVFIMQFFLVLGYAI
ncbi:MAG: hypothetical protein KJZ93_16425, partial [Caldilineaceae bacterium]|nr:hypothetical protein [Caldilineaceae bacterium]